MARIHLSPEHPQKSLTLKEKEMLNEISIADEKAIMASVLAKVLPAKDPDKARMTQIALKYSVLKTEKEMEMSNQKP